MNQLPAIHQVLTAATSDAAEYRLAPSVLFLKVWDGSSRLLDLGGESFGLPTVSTTLLDVTLRDGPEAAVQEVARQCAIPVARVRADFEPFLQELGRRGLLTRSGRGSRWRGCLGGWLASPVPYALRFLLHVIPSWPGKARALLALAYVSLGLFGWARTVELWQRATADGAAPDPAADLTLLEQLDQTIRAALAQSLFPVDCKARALCGWTLLRSAGLSARLVVGIDLFPFLGHCWCESGDRIVADRIDRCGRFTPVLQYA
jgi:hypothetical protein